MDTILLSRLQFAVATMFHFIFVPLTLGLSVLVAIMETRYVRTGDETYKRMAKFWGKLFLINFALGVVTGITLEFQFGTNWSRYSRYVGDIFGSLLAIEATLAFFLESTFIAVWIFGWNKLSPKVHALAIWIVAIASNVSAYWILVANAWMQKPVGYVIRNNRAELTDFMAVITSDFARVTFVHTVAGAFLLAGFFVMGISSYHLLRKNETEFFSRSFRMGAICALICSLLEVWTGHYSGTLVSKYQPSKLAAMEAIWETEENPEMHLILIPDEKNERNRIEWLGIPNILKWMAYSEGHTQFKGLKSFSRDQRPPVALTYYSFRIMVGLGFLFVLLSGLAWWKRKRIMESPGLMRMLLYSIPLPYLAIELGWIVTEVGRQPWIVYGIMKTKAAVSPIAVSQVATSLVAFILVYTLLGAADIYLLIKYARKGPDPETVPVLEEGVESC
jgi:cytochrome bd ubiquinol oxidase subunit I